MGRNLNSCRIETLESFARKFGSLLHPRLDQQVCDRLEDMVSGDQSGRSYGLRNIASPLLLRLEPTLVLAQKITAHVSYKVTHDLSLISLFLLHFFVDGRVVRYIL